MQKIIAVFIVCLILNGCALRVGMKPDVRINQRAYPPIQGPVRVFCLPCFEFDGDSWSIGLMFVDGWPVLFAQD